MIDNAGDDEGEDEPGRGIIDDDGKFDFDADIDDEILRVGDEVLDLLIDGVTEGVRLVDGVMEGVTLIVGVMEGVTEMEGVLEGVMLIVGVIETENEIVGETDDDVEIVGVIEDDTEMEDVTLFVEDGDEVTEIDGDEEAEMEELTDPDIE